MTGKRLRRQDWIGTNMTNDAMSIAVLIPCYNYERYIAEAIDSVLYQSRPADEIIVVDDGSTDRSAEIAASYGQRITLIRQSNAGHAAALRTAFAMSSATVIQLLDADDRLLPDALAKVAENWSEDTIKAQFDLTIIDAEGLRLGRNLCRFSAGYDASMVADEFKATGTYRWPVSSGNAYHRKLFSKICDLTFTFPFDGVLNTLAPLFGEITTIPMILGEYRLHGSNKSRRAKSGVVSRPDFSHRINMRYGEIALMRTVAAQRSIDVSRANPLDHELAFLNYRLISKRLMLPYENSHEDRRRSLWLRSVRLGWHSSSRITERLSHAIWFTALAGIPAILVDPLVNLRFGRADLKTSLQTAFRRAFK